MRGAGAFHFNSGLAIRWAAALLLAGVMVLAGLRATPVARAEANLDVDLALVLAVDCSFSVDATEFRLQMQGLGQAFRHQEIQDAIAQGPNGRIVVSVFQWSDDRSQLIVVPWTDRRSAVAAATGRQLETMPRRLAEGGTSISGAMRFARRHAAGTAPFAPPRRVMDISSDGRNNIGIARTGCATRSSARHHHQALVIINEWPTLDKYFEQQVVGGPAHFVMVANDYIAYAEAIYRKLLREITGPGIS